MLRRKEDMKDWQREEIGEEIVGVKAPEGIPVDDSPEVQEEVIAKVTKPKPKRKAVKKSE